MIDPLDNLLEAWSIRNEPVRIGLWLLLVMAASSLGCDREDASDAPSEYGSGSLEPDLRIDGYAADLVPVSWMGVSPNGTIALTQIQDGNLRFFDSKGNDLGSVGRSGAGPGEFARPVRGGWLVDTLWISDVELNRITLISPELEVVRTLPPLAAAIPRPEDSDRLPTFNFVFPFAFYPGDVALAVAMGSAGDPLAEAFKGPPLIRVTSDGQLERLVLETPENRGSIAVRFDGGVASVSVPFFARPEWAVSPDGSRIVTVTTTVTGPEGGTFRVRLYHAEDGTELFDRTYPFEGVAIPDHAVDSAIAARPEWMDRPEVRGAFDEAKSQIPPVYAPVRAILIGSDGRVWVGLYQASQGDPWLVLSPSGEPIGRLIVAGNVSLRVVDASHAWALEEDEVGVESVIRYRLPNFGDP